MWTVKYDPLRSRVEVRLGIFKTFRLVKANSIESYVNHLDVCVQWEYNSFENYSFNRDHREEIRKS